MAPKYAEVVLPVPLDRPFSYSIPPEFEAGVRVGIRVGAPWGRRALTGVVVGLSTELPDGITPAQIKPLAGVLDLEPVIDAPTLALVRWAAAYYQSPIGEVMRCAVPPGGAHGRADRPKLAVRYALPQPEPVADPRTPAQEKLLQTLRAAGGEADSAWLRARVSASALATLLRHGLIERRETERALPPPRWEARPRVQLNSSQQRALAVIEAALEAAVAGARPVLLHGVTGSGKTAVYIAAIERALERGGSALLLVPEIGLTPALFADFADAFPALVAVLHSGLTQAERAQHWRRLQAGTARVAIGTRSAIFAPLPRLGLIVVDEEHDGSYKQQEAPRYQARDLAVLRGRLTGAAVVLGSATPSLESYANAQAGKYQLVEMTERVEHRPLPTVEVIDMGAEFRSVHAGAAPRRRSGERAPDLLLSRALQEALAERLRLGQQSLVLMNRRGFAPVVVCRSCGANLMCRDCAVTLSFHKRDRRLLCHFCGFSRDVPSACPDCGSEHIYFLGSGSEKVEETLTALFPQARIARLDRDTTRNRRHFEHVLGEFRRGRFDILVGTQMIAKGHDVANVTLVGVLQADQGLSFPDFRAAERTYQLLTQVAGRAGRGEQPGRVLLQVMHPEHYAVTAAANPDARAAYAAYYGQESHFRRWMHYPPFAALASVQLRHTDYDRALHWATRAAEYMRTQQPAAPEVRVLGPAPALLARAKTEYRFQFLLKSASRRQLGVLLTGLRRFAAQEKFPATALIVDVDPLSL